MEYQYGIADLRQFIGGRPLYPTLPPPSDLLSTHPYDMVAVFRPDSTNTSVAMANTSAGGGASISGATAGDGFSGFEMEAGVLNGSCGGGRWPRQETLTLLEIRSRLNPKFKEANQKGPLWDEVSRLLCEEHGYQRSGKKCREKFENLYKYYKKTKYGKAGRQDGKHYRFFRQLEALYGDTNNQASASESHLANGSFNCNYPNNSSLPNFNNQESFEGSKLSDTSLSLSNFSEYGTTSSDDSDRDVEGTYDKNDPVKKKNKIRSRRGWKIKIKDFIDTRMRKVMDKQEVWMEKIMNTIEQKEQDMISREEEWRKQDAARIEIEHKFWESERAWIEARDSALMDAFLKMTQTNSMDNESQEAKCEMVNNYVLKCNNKKRNLEQSICDQGGSSSGGAVVGVYGEQGVDHSTIMRLSDHPHHHRHGNSSEQGIGDHDHAIRLNNDHQPNSSRRHQYNAISENYFSELYGGSLWKN